MIASTPYKKEYDQAGNLLNPITKENPYLFSPIGIIDKRTGLPRVMRYKMWQIIRNKFFTGKTVVKC